VNEVSVLEVGREAMWVTLIIAGPIMAAGMVVGLIIALFQALTTLQEMTLTFVPKIVVIFVGHFLFVRRLMSVSGRFTGIVNRLRLGPAEPVPDLSAEELLAAIQEAARTDTRRTERPSHHTRRMGWPARTKSPCSARASRCRVPHSFRGNPHATLRCHRHLLQRLH